MIGIRSELIRLSSALGCRFGRAIRWTRRSVVCQFAVRPSMGSVLEDARDVMRWLINAETARRAVTCVSNAWIASRLPPSIDFAIFHAGPGAGPPWISLRRMRRRAFRTLRGTVAPSVLLGQATNLCIHKRTVGAADAGEVQHHPLAQRKVAAGTELRKGCSNPWRLAAPHFS